MSPEAKFLIWSFEHRGWWKPNGNGYTEDIKEAGVYSYADAFEICTDANIVSVNEAMVPKP